jgi:hypothetical protein
VNYLDGSQPCEQVSPPPNTIPVPGSVILTPTPAAPVPCSLLTTQTQGCGSTSLVPDEFLHGVDNMPGVGMPASAVDTITDLRSAAETTNAASCSPYPWRPLNLQECR